MLMQNIWILIPAYNEAVAIGPVISNLKKHGYSHVLVVDDGSRDDTAAVARTAGAEVLEHLINRGQGGALQTGINYLSEEYSPEIIITFDADGQHRPEDIAALIRPIQDDQSDIVLGSRFLDPTSEIPPLRLFILKLGILFTNIVSHIRLTDTHNGLRAMNQKAYQAIRITHRGMEHASDIIDEITRKNLRYTECPVTVIYSDYSKAKGQSSIGFIKMGCKLLLRKLM